MTGGRSVEPKEPKLFIPPVRPELVRRPRLIQRVNRGMPCKLPLVSVPAGDGKTTPLTEWIHHGSSRVISTSPVAWRTLDEAGNDPTRFLTYVIGAAQRIVPQIGEGLLGMLRSSQPASTQSVLTTLLNELTAVPHTSGRGSRREQLPVEALP